MSNYEESNEYDEQDSSYGRADEPTEETDDHAVAAEIEATLGIGPYRWSHRSTPKLDRALAAAQGEMRNAELNKTNPHLKSRYADLAAVVLAIREPMSKHGVARYQTPHTSPVDGKLYITTRLACDGEWVEADFRVPFESLKGLRAIQSVGNAITYVKRYALTSMAGIAAGEDDDGESGPEPERSSTKREPAISRWAPGVKAFEGYNVKPAQMLAYVGKESAEQLDHDDHDALESLYKGLARGEKWAKTELAKLS